MLAFALVACTSDPPVPPPSEVPLDWGTGEGCATAAGDASMATFWDADPKLVVYGEGEAERRLAESVLGWYGDDGDLELVAASDLTEAQKASSDLFIVGGSDANPLLIELQGHLPVWFEPGRFTFGGYRWDAVGHGVGLVHPSPWAPGQHLLVFGGNTVHGAASLFSIPTGSLDHYVTRGSMLQLEGRLCREDDALWGYREPRATDLRADWDAFADGLLSQSTAMHVFHYRAGSRFSNDPSVADWQEDRLAEAIALLELEPPEHRIHWYLYEDNAEKADVTGDGGNGHANVSAFEVHAVHGPALSAMGAHEDVHVLQYEQLGRTSWAVLGEGMAVMTDGRWQGTPLRDWGAEHIAAGDLPALADLVDDFWGAGGGSDLGYGASGSFNAFVRETWGIDALKAVYTTSDLHQAFVDELGRTTAELDADWRAWLSAP
ncbi:MAG: hypothetical protein H6734_11875 [Alphaproteobacteria bacterium]|nr:hypothetical protein [Alphaproteobacteria bacterium]